MLSRAAALGLTASGLGSLLAACAAPAAPAPAAPATSGSSAQPSSNAPAPAPAPAAPSPAAAAAPASASAASAAASNARLTGVLHLEPNSLDPAQSTYVPGIIALKNVVETLIDLDDSGQAKPRLATKWDVSADGTVWTWTLREGITFHDGTPFNAEAVKFTFDRIQDPATKSQTGIALIGPYQSSEVIDAKTVKMTFKQPYAPLLHNLSQTVLGIVSPTAVKKFGEEFAQNPVGTGPYVYKEWVKGDHITLTRYDKYVNTSTLTAHDGPPYLETLLFRIILEDQTRLATLKNGEADWIFRIPPLDVDTIRNDPRFQVLQNVFTGAPTMFLINRQLPPTDDLAVAKAIQFAVNKEVCSRIATKNLSPVAWGPLKPTNFGYNPEVEQLYRFDPEQAKKLLDEAGWVPGPDGIRVKNGQPAKLLCNVKSDAVTVSMLEAIQGMLKAVGLDLEIKTMALAASEDLARQGKNNLTFMDWRGTDPDILTVHFHSMNIGGWNMGFFKNPELDNLLDTARTTLDQEKRLGMYKQAQLLIMEQAATLPLFAAVQVDGAKANLEGFRYDAAKAYPEFYDVRFKA